jgi:hypothetical protein
MKNFYKLNKDYIRTFQIRMMDRYRAKDKRTETSLFKSLLEEINNLFMKMGGRISSKKDIPAGTDYPDSKVYNKLLSNIGFDIDKLFNAQKLIESDINNLINFNSNQRNRTFESLTTAQQEVYSAYTKAKRDTIGGVGIPEGTPFASADNMSTESEDVFIDQARKVLTLACDSTDSREIDATNTNIYFAGREPLRPIYPDGRTLGIGSHWKKMKNDPHFIKTDDIGSVETYKTMMVDDPNNNIGVGFCEFEAVRTSAYEFIFVTEPGQKRFQLVRTCGTGVPVITQLNSRSKVENSAIKTLKEYIEQKYGIDSELIYMDLPNSIQGKYILGYPSKSRYSQETPQYKLVVPFLTNILTNEITIDFSANANGYIPKINWNESKVYSKVGGGDVAYNLIAPSTDQDSLPDGRYVLHTTSFVIPTRMELILDYDTDNLMWIPFDFYMSHYVYSDQKTYPMPYIGDEKINITIKKSYDIFVDTELNETKEKSRALNVLRSPDGGYV